MRYLLALMLLFCTPAWADLTLTAGNNITTTKSGVGGTLTVGVVTNPSISKLSNLTTNGLVKTSGSDGTLSVDTSTYLTAVDSNTDWTKHNSYPASCAAGMYVRGLGDTLDCYTPAGGGGGTGVPGGSDTQIQYNNAGVFNGVDGFIYNGTVLSYANNIGIGSTNPAQRLDVDGTIYAHNYIAINTASPRATLDVNGTIYGTGFQIPTGAAAGYLMTASNGSGVGGWAAPAISSQWTGTAPIYYTAGNVGINTTVPRYKLEVDGSIYSTALTVDGSLYTVGVNVGIGSTAPQARLDVIGSGYISPVGVTADPCGTQPEGTMFYNSTGHKWCFCDNAGVDLNIYGGLACF
jgi:hypothetical protein